MWCVASIRPLNDGFWLSKEIGQQWCSTPSRIRESLKYSRARRVELLRSAGEQPTGRSAVWTAGSAFVLRLECSPAPALGTRPDCLEQLGVREPSVGSDRRQTGGGRVGPHGLDSRVPPADPRRLLATVPANSGARGRQSQCARAIVTVKSMWHLLLDSSRGGKSRLPTS
jgi:hypothetical protein